ncbi:MAG TPA: BamA/TamA family outer membrane protein [Pyrinomonadaceae bacterium]|nr:BamA/TamA family outer membrane protein [Pyrinomonadaceae bacterium]
MKHVAIAFTLLSCFSWCAAQTCEVLKDENGQQRRNGSQLCVTLKITNGALDIDRSQSQFAVSDEFKRRLAIPPAEAEQIVFTTLSNVLKNIQKPYRLALSDADKIRDDKAELNDPKTNAIRTANSSWTDYLQQFDDWASSTNRTSMQDVFSDFESTALTPLVNAEVSTALLVWQDGSFDAEQGTLNLIVLDPINNWSDETQVKISFPDLSAGPKTDAKRRRMEKLLSPMTGRPRCYECMKATLESYYTRMGFDPEIDFDDRNTSPLRISVIESRRIVSISWRSLENDPNIDKLLYSLLTDKAFRHYVKQRASIGSIFNYRQQTGEPGPYLNAQRLQIQQLLVTQLGYAASLTPAAGEAGTSSSFNITIQKLSEPDETEDGGSAPTQTNEHPEPAPATANPEGVVTAHEQEENKETDFHPENSGDKPKDKKRYVGGGFEYRPEQGVKFFALGQVSRVPLVPGAVNNLSVKIGGFGDAGVLGNANYFADYIFFNKLHRRMSVQFTVASDLENDRNLTAPNTDERRSTGLARLEFELFRDRSGSLLRFSAETRNETVELKSNLEPLVKANMTTLEFGAFYLFESVEVELPRRIRFEPKFRAGLGLAVGEPRYNKFLATGNFHQMLPARYEFDVTGRAEVASEATPLFELPALGGTDILRGFRADDGFGRKFWTLQNEVWIPLTIGNDQSTGLKAMLREKVKIASFVDVGGLYDAIDVSPGMRAGTGMGLRVIYNPIIFKFDFGYGFGEKASSGGRGKFHFSVTSNLPF